MTTATTTTGEHACHAQVTGPKLAVSNPQPAPSTTTDRQTYQIKAEAGATAQRMWDYLVQDSGAPAPMPAGVGQTELQDYLIQWCCQQQGQLLAIQVLDKRYLQMWECAVAALPGQRTVVTARKLWQNPVVAAVAGATGVALYERLLQHLLASAPIEPATSRNEPHFMALTAAGCNAQGLASIRDDSNQLLNAREDAAYWRDLARTQARLLRQRPKSAAPGSFPKAEQAPEADEPPARQWRLDEMDEWAALNAERIVIMPRAIAAARRSPYEDRELVYQCLEMLATEYPAVKRGELPRNAFMERALALGLEVGGSVDPSRAGQYGDEYFVRFGRQKLFLDQHLRKGSARDPRFALRIYYTWDEEIERVIVGWLPSHLTNSKT